MAGKLFFFYSEKKEWKGLRNHRGRQRERDQVRRRLTRIFSPMSAPSD
jgi:hypothetical protein